VHLKAYDIITVGSFVVGLTVRLPRMPHAGESLVADLFDMGPGGKGTNLAVTAARQGAKLSMIVRVGEDQFADMAFELYKKEGISTEYVLRTRGEPTAVGLVYLQHSGENTIGFYRGANWLLSPTDIINAKHLFEKSKLLATQFEVPDETLLQALRLAKEHNLMTLLNPAPARLVSKELLQVDYLTPNEGEAKLLLGLEPDAASEPEELLKALLKLGPKTVIITLGDKGCIYASQGEPAKRMAAHKVKVIDTVGAGDAFNGGLAAALAKGSSLEAALRQAMITAALSVTKLGSIEGLPSQREVEEYAQL